MSMSFPEAVFIGPDALLEISTKKENVKNYIDDKTGKWDYYYNGTLYHSTSGTPENNPDMISYNRPSWTKVNNFLENARAAGVPIYFK